MTMLRTSGGSVTTIMATIPVENTSVAGPAAVRIQYVKDSVYGKYICKPVNTSLLSENPCLTDQRETSVALHWTLHRHQSLQCALYKNTP